MGTENTEKEPQKEEDKEEEIVPTGIDTPVIFATGFGISTAKDDLLILSFIFSPPENENMAKIIFRAGMFPEMAAEIADAIKKTLEKNESKEEGKLSKETKSSL